MKNYNDLTRIQQEKYLLLPILNELKKIGGSGSTTEIKKTLVENNEYLPEDVLTETKVSSKGNEYRPFDFPYNFAIANLCAKDYIDRPKRGYIKLTKKGHDFNGNSKELCHLVYSNNAPTQKEKSSKEKILNKIYCQILQKKRS